ncbi:ANTAR domain-containing protein [Streptomyces violascens]|uniref:Transcription antitermination regulator n=1 Tax=Streptomyces violascens TaxID=67381 RepID=A0ABQ3QU86_9ACTN|nr:ANTAR domain-containing protein [Streptomyces violascens]GGU06540.1 transcription antitermination regulator [Streptomyces violascens]GHI40830.1 transcription antitermination regulator [Streptomyces violascens]
MTDVLGGTGTEEDGTAEEAERLRREIRDLRAQVRTRPLIAQAQGLLTERYRLRGAEVAFALMQQASQRFNIKLRTVAEAVIAVPRPDTDQRLWFPGRTRRSAPPLDTLGMDGADHAHHSEVLGAVLTQALAITSASMGNVQLADRAGRVLRMEKHTGLSDEFVDFFAVVGDRGTSCAQAAADVAQTTVRDVATDPVFTPQAREAILKAGSRACHSIPLATSDGTCVGMVSAHLDRPIQGLHLAQLAALEQTGRQAGAWLSWHERTIVLDALEYLHATARDPAATPPARRR